jgi:2-methylcitrate dehydratase PrpD
MSVTEQLSSWAVGQLDAGVPEHARHEAKRLVLNQFKASVPASAHPAIQIMNKWATLPTHGSSPARVLWLGTESTPERAAFVNGALFEVLDFHDTYIPCFLHAVSAVLPAALAVAESESRSGAEFVDALALGIEVELALATILMPTGYTKRGFVPLGLVGAVGAAVACSILGGLDASRMRNAIGLAVNTSGGSYESAGNMALAYITGSQTRAGITAYELAADGVDAPVTALEGEMGALRAYSEEGADKIPAIIESLGTEWRIHGQSYKTLPTETITHAPIECAFALRERASGREAKAMRFGVSPIVVKIADERAERFGQPSSEQEARFDLKHCAAAAWVRGRFGLAEMQESAFTDPAIRDVRSQVALVPDEARASFDGCWLEVDFTDGSTERVVVDAFKGSVPNPVSDEELAAIFRETADGHLSEGRAGEIVEATLGLEKIDVPDLMELCT